MDGAFREVELRTISYLGTATNLYEFLPTDGQPCEHAGPGSHIDLHLPDGRIRPYSLIELRPDAYVIAVRREADGGGASRYLHDQARVGQRFGIGGCRNLFPLDPQARHTVLIAGGIGITPMLPMVEQLGRERRSWELHVASKDPRPAFHDALRRHGSAVHFYRGSAPGPHRLDLHRVIGSAPEGAVFHCCGPDRMVQAFLEATKGLPEERVRIERFKPAAPPASEGGFEVQLFRQQRRLTVHPGQTILDCLQAAGLPVKASCLQGICGSCETRVLAGRPDHRDGILQEAERASNTTMMICCSGSLDPVLVLDL